MGNAEKGPKGARSPEKNAGILLKDTEILDAYLAQIKNRLAGFPEDDPGARKIRMVFERIIAAQESGDTQKAMKYAASCIILIDKYSSSTRKIVAASGISPALRRIAEEIDELQSKSMEMGVDVIKSERLRITAVDAIEMGLLERANELLKWSLDTLREEIRVHVLRMLQIYQVETERAKSIGIVVADAESLIRNTRLSIARDEYSAALISIYDCHQRMEEIKKEYNTKTSTFECPVCGAINNVESQECSLCGTLFPELGPVYGGEKIRIALPKKAPK